MNYKGLVRSIGLLFCLLLLLLIQGFRQDGSKNRIHQVENNLISWVKLDGDSNWNITDRMRANNVLGLSICVIHDYKIDWCKGYGITDTISQDPVTEETLFQTASIGKSINGFAFMKLAQDGVISLDKDINTYLKRWKFPYDSTSSQAISLKAILSHTAGLSVEGFDGYLPGQEIPTLEQILMGDPPANNRPVQAIFAPGDKFQYSGGGYEISEILLEDVTGSSYADFIREEIFQPLKMESSSYMIPSPSGFKIANGYRYDQQPIGDSYHIYPEKACGAGLWSTPADIAKFVIDLQKALKDDSGEVIERDYAKQMTTPVQDDAGLGVFINKKGDRQYFQHSGLNEGFSSIYVGSLDGGDGVVIFTNSDFTDFMYEIVNAVATVYDWKNYYPFVPKKIAYPSKEVLKRYVGNYIFENADSGPEISMDSVGLNLQAPGAPTKWRMYFTSDEDFFMLESKWVNQQFYFNESGITKGFKIVGDDSSFNVIRQ